MKKDRVKLYEAKRHLTTLETVNWSEIVDVKHPARRVVSVLDQMDLKELYNRVKSEKHELGRPAIDPKLMLALLVYAATKGISSSRMIEELSEWEPGFRWILGHGLSVSHTKIASFRKEVGTYLDNILTQVVTLMVASGVIDLEEVILDGTKIKANAGKGSFHTRDELQELQKEISEKLANLSVIDKKKNEEAALKRKQERVERALKEIPCIQQSLIDAADKKKKGKKAKEAKTSSTDGDAGHMRFPDKSYAPAYNAQIITSSKGGVIVELKTTQKRNDTNLMTPMLDSFEEHYGIKPKRILADIGYSVQEDIITVEEREVEVYCPQKKGQKNSTEESKRKLANKRAKEPEVLRNWRAKMETTEARVVRSRRRRTEKVHGWIKSKMTHSQLSLRGIGGAQTQLLVSAIGYNMIRFFNLKPLKVA